MSESPAEFLEPEPRDEPETVRDRGADGPCRDPRTSAQPETPDVPYGDG